MSNASFATPVLGHPPTLEDLDSGHRSSMIEFDITNGTKRSAADLIWFLDYRFGLLTNVSGHWRHIESETVYGIVGMGLAATGKGTLALMVHYEPTGEVGPRFERQHALFMERFEPVVEQRTWVRSR